MTLPLFSSIEQARVHVSKTFHPDKTFDVGMKEVLIWGNQCLLVYITGFVDAAVLTQLLTNVSKAAETTETFEEIIQTRLPFYSVTVFDDLKKWQVAILSGQVGVIGEDGKCYSFDVRNYPGRQPDEPDNEKVVRGSRDGFTENILQNTTLIRRRIRDEKLRFELYNVSSRGKTDVAICYLEDVVNEQFIKFIRDRLNNLQQDGLTMAEKSLEELLFKQSFHPMPFARYTERADTCAGHILEGHIAIIVDTSPSILIVPATLLHHLQHAEEFRQSPFVGTVVRSLRYVAFLMSFLLLPFWYLLATHPEHVPAALKFIGPKEDSAIPLFLQLLIGDIGLEFLRMAAIHTPTPLSTAMGLVAAAVVGQIAIDVGLFQPEVILYLAVAAIFTYAIPSYELSVVLKSVRMFVLLLTVIAGVPGFFIAILFVYLNFVYLKPMYTPYLWPVVPLFPKALFRSVVRQSLQVSALRPYILHTKFRQRK